MECSNKNTLRAEAKPTLVKQAVKSYRCWYCWITSFCNS